MPFHAKIPLAGLPWQPGAHPLERKKWDPNYPVTLLEFGAGFADPNWCSRAHAGYVLAGTLRLEYEGESETLGEGEAFLVDAGTPHRASNPGRAALRLFIISSDGDVPWGTR